MVSQVSFTQDAMRYVQGASIEDKKPSLASDIAFSTATSTIFSGLPKYLIKNRNEIAETSIKATDTRLAKVAADALKETAKDTKKVGPFKFIGNKIAGLIPDSIKTSGLGKLITKHKAGAAMVAFDVAIGTVTEVIPAFKELGAGEGFKQIGKTVAQAAGYAAGYAAGSALGAKIGGAIGTVGGPLGTVVGALVGMVGGALVSGIVKKITGPHASEKIAKKQEEAQAAQIAQDPQAVAELQQMVVQKVAEDQASGKVTEDTQKMAAYIQTMNATPSASYATPSFTGMNSLVSTPDTAAVATATAQTATTPFTTPFTTNTNPMYNTTTYNPFTTSAMYNGNVALADANMYAVPASHYQQGANDLAAA